MAIRTVFFHVRSTEPTRRGLPPRSWRARQRPVATAGGTTGDLTARLDLNQLAPAPGSFVDDALRWRHSDLLFTAPLDGRSAFVYVLVEHQGRTEPLMAYRMLRYVVRIWERHVAEHPRAQSLPAVIPVVVHHNRQAWSAATHVQDLIDLNLDRADAVHELIPRFGFLLDDLVAVDEQALRDRPLTPLARVTLLLLKVAPGNPHLADDMDKWADEFRAVLDSGGTDDFVALLTYIEKVSETPADDLHDLFAKVGPDAEEAYMTTTDMLRTEGRTKGLAEGRTEGRAESLKQLLELKFGPLPDGTLGKLHAASTDQLETWTAPVLTADKIDDVLR